MNNKFSAASDLGYAVLFISTWLSSMVYAHWISGDAMSNALPMMMILGGIVLAIAGIFSFFREGKIEPVLFLVIGAASFSWTLRYTMSPNLPANTGPAAMDGWILIVIAAVVFCLWLASFKGHLIRQLFLLGLWLSHLAGALVNWTNSGAIGTIGGYIGLITALLALWYFLSSVTGIEKAVHAGDSETEASYPG